MRCTNTGVPWMPIDPLLAVHNVICCIDGIVRRWNSRRNSMAGILGHITNVRSLHIPTLVYVDISSRGKR